jgi:hypothetical protein
MSHLPACIALATILLFSGCEKRTTIPLPPIGTKALIRETIVVSAVNATDLVSGKSSEPYLCRVTEETQIRSLRNNKDNLTVHVLLEENSKEDRADGHLSKDRYLLSPQGAVVQLDNYEFRKAVGYVKNRERSQQELREAKKAIKEELLKQEQ